MDQKIVVNRLPNQNKPYSGSKPNTPKPKQSPPQFKPDYQAMNVPVKLHFQDSNRSPVSTVIIRESRYNYYTENTMYLKHAIAFIELLENKFEFQTREVNNESHN